MCQYYIHLSIEGIRLDRIRPQDLLLLLKDIRWKRCEKGDRCKKTKFEQVHWVPDLRPCRAQNCQKTHSDGTHISYHQFIKPIGTQLGIWVVRKINEWKKKKHVEKQDHIETEGKLEKAEMVQS